MTGLILALAAVPASGAGWGLPANSTTTPATAARSLAELRLREQECGRNSLYVLLRLLGRPVDHREVAAAAAVGPAGTSMLQLRDAAARLGLEAEVCRCTLADLVQGPKPVIAHLKWSESSLGTHGHYVVVTAADDANVYVIDGSLGVELRYTHDDFVQAWSGHVLVPRDRDSFVPTALVGSLWLGVGAWAVRRFHRSRPARA